MLIPDPVSFVFKIYKMCDFFVQPTTQTPASIIWKGVTGFFTHFMS